MLDILVQPPRETRPGTCLFPPLAVRFTSETSLENNYGQYFAFVTPIGSNDETPVELLSGKVSDSAHPWPESVAGGSNSQGDRYRVLFYYNDLVIHENGRYKLRISLYEMNSPLEAATLVDYIDSPEIIVDEQTTTNSRPSKSSLSRHNIKLTTRR